MKKYLIIVDMQNDFIDGSLGTIEAKAIVAKVLKKTEQFSGNVIFTQDSHDDNYLQTQEGINLPVKHCITSTKGWELHPDLALLCNQRKDQVYQKDTFGCVDLAADLAAKHQQDPIDSIELVGLCTDICVISNALLLKAFLPEVPIYVDSACCAGVDVNRHNMALEAMKMCQIQIR